MYYKGELSGVPQEIVVKMLERQRDQGNKSHGFEAFEDELFAQKDEGGFDWDDAPEGGDFWERVLEYEGHRLFFDKYPRKTWEDYTEGNYVIVTEFGGNPNYKHWFKPLEVLKLGGHYWEGSLKMKFAAINREYPGGNGMNVAFEDTYKLRHATDQEILASRWAAEYIKASGKTLYDPITLQPVEPVEAVEYILAKGDTYLNSQGKKQIITGVIANEVYYCHANGTIYHDTHGIIVDRLRRNVYTEYKSVNNQVNQVNQLKTSKDDEVRRKNSEQGRPRGKGSRATRQTVTIASASRPAGSRVSNIRQRSRGRDSTVSGSRLFSN